MRSIIVIPTYNEAENIPDLVSRLGEVAPDSHLLIVDDGSPDGTADLAERCFGGREGWRVYRRTGPRGLGLAYSDALTRVLAEGYEVVLHMDADLSHDPADVPRLFDAVRTADMVIGSRYCPGGGVRNWPPHRIVLSRWANRYVRAVTGVPVRDATSGFRCWTSRALSAIDPATLRSSGYAFLVELTVRATRAGMHIAETPITFTDRRAGASKMTTAVILESMLMPWRFRFQWHANGSKERGESDS